ncbi:zinc finger CCCH domain-containing protein 53-like [Typha angustifolia]|uniref:zinc finger CCCH domain-containing protein 53-like n=1 Tax=Typha angustifolia TaxID=59011 RepID=UPI003C2B1836
MDAYEATRIVFSRIQNLDPEHAAKIMGLLLLQDHGEKEMIRLAFGPEALLHSVILKARKDLGLFPISTPSSPSSPSPFLLSRQNSCRFLGTTVASSPPSSWVNELAGGGELLDDFQLQDQLCFGAEFGCKPCLYFARGYCKNGTSCRFLHGLPDEDQHGQDLLLRSKSCALPFSPTGSSNKCLDFLLQQQSESQREALFGRSRLLERSDFSSMMNPGSRQIYLTFPADSTFREEDVSNYFSIYGPVQDVRIPYQQKRMFGFVTFVHPETVKLILAKGNPHFVCDARVLVKPYKEKGKVPDKYRKQQLGERGDFPNCTTPTGLDSRDPYDLQQLGARMLYNNSSELLLRRKLEEQQQAVELQQAIELQSRRFMGLQLLDLKSRSLSSPTANSNFNSFNSTMRPTTPTIITTFSKDGRIHNGSPEKPTLDEKRAELKKVNSSPQQTAVNATDKEESGGEASPNGDGDFQESLEHNLPDSPFASPTKSSPFVIDSFAEVNTNANNHILTSSLLPPASALDLPSFKTCFFQMPRYSSGPEEIGM